MNRHAVRIPRTATQTTELTNWKSWVGWSKSPSYESLVLDAGFASLSLRHQSQRGCQGRRLFCWGGVRCQVRGSVKPPGQGRVGYSPPSTRVSSALFVIKKGWFLFWKLTDLQLCRTYLVQMSARSGMSRFHSRKKLIRSGKKKKKQRRQRFYWLTFVYCVLNRWYVYV